MDYGVPLHNVLRGRCGCIRSDTAEYDDFLVNERQWHQGQFIKCIGQYKEEVLADVVRAWDDMSTVLEAGSHSRNSDYREPQESEREALLRRIASIYETLINCRMSLGVVHYSEVWRSNQPQTRATDYKIDNNMFFKHWLRGHSTYFQAKLVGKA